MNKHQEKRRNYAVMEMMTGAMDGWYPSLKDANEVCEYLSKEKHPWGEWIVIESKSGYGEIRNNRFHAHMFMNVPTGLTSVRDLIEALNNVSVKEEENKEGLQ